MSCSKLYTTNLATQTHAEACMWLWLCLDYACIKVKGKRYKKRNSETTRNTRVYYLFLSSFFSLFSIIQLSFKLHSFFRAVHFFCTHSFIYSFGSPINRKVQRESLQYTLYSIVFCSYSTLMSVQLNKFHHVYFFFSGNFSRMSFFLEKYLSIVNLRSNLIEISIFFFLLHLTLRKKEKNQQRKVGSSHWTCVYMLVSP